MKFILMLFSSLLHRSFCALSALLLFCGSASVWAAEYSLVYSDRADWAASQSLFYAELRGDVYIRLAPGTGNIEDVEQVAFYLDSARTPYFTDTAAPYDLAGGLPFDTTALSDGRHTIYTKVKLRSGRQPAFTTSFDVVNGDVPRPPVLAFVAAQTMQVAERLRLQFSATDANGDDLAFAMTGLPDFAVLSDQGNGTATLTFNPLAADVGRYVMTVSVSDGGLSDSQSFTLDVNNAPARSPVLSGIPNQSVRAAESLTVQLSATDPDGDALAFSVASLPGFAVFSDQGDGTATLTFNPLAADVGRYVLAVSVNDGGLSDSQSFTLDVGAALVRPPVLAPISTQRTRVGESLTLPLSATDLDSAVLNFSSTNLPDFAVLTDLGDGRATLAFNPLATDMGRYVISVSVTDGDLSDSQSFTLEVGGSLVGRCGEQTGTVVAIPFDYVTPMAVGKYITLAVTSPAVEFNTHSASDAPDINWSRRYKAYKYGDGGGVVDIWRLASVPPNGALYEGQRLLAVDDVINDPDDLFYVPNDGFAGDDSFTYCATDFGGQSNIATVTIEVASTSQYPMPYGIPDPGFGIDETPPADPPEWPGAERAGFYYIDSDHPLCSNSANSYGFPALPRCAIPATGASVVAGGKMVLAPSELPYALRRNSWHLINFEGTAENPSWLVGNEQGPNKPVIVPHPDKVNTNMALRITGGYLRITGVVLDGLRLNHRGGGVNEVVVRHSEVKNYYSTGGGGSAMGLSTEGNGVLAFNVYVHDNGVVEAAGLSRERDIHAFVGSSQTGFWMLDIRCDENAGDCVQLTNNNNTANVYVGRMVAHSEGENCVDIKDFNRVVVSESDCWDLRKVQYGNSTGNSQSFYVNDEGVQQNYVYFLNNRSWDTAGTNYATSNLGGRVYFIGNLSFASPLAQGFYSGGGNGSRYVYFNTFVDSEVGIEHFGSGSALDRYMAGNVVDGASPYQTRVQSSSAVINVLDYNFYSDVGDFASGGSSPSVYSGLAAFNAAMGFEANGTEGISPGFVGAAIYDFSLTAGSHLRGAVPSRFVSSLPFLDDLFNDLAVRFRDRAGLSRLQGADYDAGALSYSLERDTALEANVPDLMGATTGDGDGDGIADSAQNNVTSFQAPDGSNWLTYRNNNNATQRNFIAGTAALSVPADQFLAYGMTQYDVEASAGARVTIEVYVTQNTAIRDYLLLSNDGQWKAQYAAVSHAGNKTKLVFSVVEGGEFDRDATANGSLQLAQGGVMVRSGFEISPYAHSFGVTELNTATANQTFTLTNTGSRAVRFDSVVVDGAYADQFKIATDNCGGQSIAAGANCTIDVNMLPTSLGSKSAWLQITSDDPDNTTTAAFLNNYESPNQQARRRLPPVLYSLSGLPEVMRVGQSYTVTWELLGYHDNYFSTIVFFDCTGVAAATCGSSYSSNFESSGVLSANSVSTGEWGYKGVQSQRASFSYTFTPTAEQFPNPADIVIRFYRKNSEDSAAGKSSLSLIIPGNLSQTYYDTSGRRIQKRVEY